MLEMNSRLPRSTELFTQNTVYDWKWMLKMLWRRPLPVLLIPLLCALLAITYVLVRPSQYTASTLLNITNLRLSSSDQNTFYAEALFDPAFLETQIQIIASEPIARSVIESTKLTEATQGDEEKALKIFRANFGVQRVGQSNLVQISYVHADPQKAASVANAAAVAYIAKLDTDRESAIQSASSWLRERLRGVGAQAHIISQATPPVDKSGMRGLLIIGASGVTGGVAGIALALILGFFDRRIRDPEQAYSAAGVECLGIVPLLVASDPTSHGKPGEGQFTFASAPSVISEVERQPFTPLWQALRYAGVAAMQSSSHAQRIAVTSTFTGEGKTTIAANLAVMAASGAKRVLLVDAQPYDPALSQMLAPGAGRGIAEFLADDSASLASHVMVDQQTGVHLLPFGATGNRETGAQLLWSSRMARLFEQARDYDLIIFDMPPLVATGDNRAAASFIDSFLLVVEWNKVPADEMHAALALAGPVRNKLIGTLLNKASSSVMERWFSPEASIIARQTQFAQASSSGDSLHKH